MELEEFYKQVGGNFEDVKRRLFSEEFIRKFVLKFKDDETFDNLIDAFNKVDYKEAFRFIHTLKGTSVNLGFDDLYQASCNLTECLREKENLNDEELEEAGKLLQIVKDNYQKIIELICSNYKKYVKKGRILRGICCKFPLKILLCICKEKKKAKLLKNSDAKP